MTWKATTEEVAPPIPDGEYNAILTGVTDMQGPHGTMARIDFMLTTDDVWDGRQVSGIASKKLSANTKLGEWIAALLGTMPKVGEEITIDDVLHKECRVVIKQRVTEKNKMVFANVVQVLSARLAE